MSATSSAIPFVVFVQEKYATRIFPLPVVGSGSGLGVGFGVGSGVGSSFCMGSSLSWLHAHMVRDIPNIMMRDKSQNFICQNFY